MSIKITPADSWFSKCVRQRANWCCERCGTQYDQSSSGLHCSHFHGRGNYAVRFNPDNVCALCFGCHKFMEANPHEHQLFFQARLGSERYDALIEARNDIDLGKRLRKTKGKGDISKWFKTQFEEMQDANQSEIFLYDG